MTHKEIADRISVNPRVCHGKPCIRGTRVMVAQVLDLLSEGVPIETITSEEYFPDIVKADVLACVAFANQFVKEEEIHFYELEKAEG